MLKWLAIFCFCILSLTTRACQQPESAAPNAFENDCCSAPVAAAVRELPIQASSQSCCGRSVEKCRCEHGNGGSNKSHDCSCGCSSGSNSEPVGRPATSPRILDFSKLFAVASRALGATFAEPQNSTFNHARTAFPVQSGTPLFLLNSVLRT